EMINAQKVELHLCEEHAAEYLHQNDIFANDSNDNSAKELQETTDSLMLDDFQTCPCCGATLQDFRKDGLLGCAHDYVVFRERLEPFFLALHGKLKHVGKRPRHAGEKDLGVSLVRLRNLLADAVQIEDYETASKLRDEIVALEKKIATAPSKAPLA
ncbi:MAG: UvrB/UvrC motif-containing protein, partial [Thermoguttaceae bacterium]